MKTLPIFLATFMYALTLNAQPVILVENLRPFHINQLIVKDLPGFAATAVRIEGRTADGQQIPLFDHSEEAPVKRLSCFLYLDESVSSVVVEVKSEDIILERTNFPVRHNPYRITVLGSRYPPLLANTGYTPASSLQELQPGDIYIVQESEAPETFLPVVTRLLAKGVHVVAPQTLVSAVEMPVVPEGELWIGRLLAADTSDPVAIQELLEKRKEQFRTLKARYYGLIAGANFYGIRIPEVRSLTFTDMNLEDIAFTVEQQLFRSRLNPVEKALLILFYLPVIVGTALIKKHKIILILVSGCALIFVLLSLLYPGRDTIFTLYLNPFHTAKNTVVLERVSGYPRDSNTLSGFLFAGPEENRFVARDYSLQFSTLRYFAVRSSGKTTPLQPFASADAVKFDQIPRVRISDGRYYLEHRKPLRAWSLHESE